MFWEDRVDFQNLFDDTGEVTEEYLERELVISEPPLNTKKAKLKKTGKHKQQIIKIDSKKEDEEEDITNNGFAGEAKS